MLTSRLSELQKRDRINAKGKDGGSFIPRAILITGTTVEGMVIALPDYINPDNFLGAQLRVEGSAHGELSSGEWIIGSGHPDFISLTYNTDNNTIKAGGIGSTAGNMESDSVSKDFKLTVFYKG
tara:strand:- start:2313 stop:2684 length:372 start_codon:yes stop_codon:yes gene_type:complete